MSNNDTLNGALTTLGELMATNLNIMSVPDAQASDGLTTLANKILDIPRFVNVVSFTINGNVDIPDFNPLYAGDNLIIVYGDDSYDSYTSGGLSHNYSDGESLHTVYVVGCLTGFGDGCFDGCTGLETVTIPESINSIGTDCFKDCNINDYELYWVGDEILSYDSNKMPTTSNTIFTIPQGETENYITAGYPADKLRERGVSPMVVLEYTGDNITIGGNSQWLPSTGDVIVDWGDGSTDTVNNPTTQIEHIYTDGVNNHTVKLIGEINSLGDDCFYGCTGLTSITIPDSVSSLGDRCFTSCTGLTSITIPDSVSSLGDRCFDGCTGLTSITIPDSVSSLGDRCFTSCTGLTSITIPDSVSSLGDRCFDGCTGLTSVVIPDTVTSIGIGCFDGCTGLTSITIPDSVSSLGNECFYGCTGLTSITIPDSVSSLGNYCFTSCTGLTSITIPDSVSSLGEFCFALCTGLTSVVIPDTVTSIGIGCFEDCTSLVDYQFYWTDNNILLYQQGGMPVNTGTIFTIPQGETTNYINKRYPANKIQERS